MKTEKHPVSKVRNNRPIYMIEQDMREAANEAATYLRSGHYARHQQAMQRAAKLKEEYEKAMTDIRFDLHNQNIDRAERSFFGKILALSLNEADLAIYHIEMFFAYFKDRGYVPVSEWEQRRVELMNAVKAYREFISYFFRPEDLRVPLELDFMKLVNLVADKMFTDRERIYYDRYEIKAAEKGGVK